MLDPLLSEPFVQRPAPRCLTDRALHPNATGALVRPRIERAKSLKRATWPLRASFERWARHLLQARSKSGH